MADTPAWVRGDWMQTYTGRRFYPAAPDPRDIDRLDIAHALSLLCRFGGHVDRFYSVAEHCCLLAMSFPDAETALIALLHDATEAYLVDVPRPVKNHLLGYKHIEENVWTAIQMHFKLAVGPIPERVKERENCLLLTERNSLMKNACLPWSQDGKYEPLPVHIYGWDPKTAEREYLDLLRYLTR